MFFKSRLFFFFLCSFQCGFDFISFLARLYESTGRAIALSPAWAEALASVSAKYISFTFIFYVMGKVLSQSGKLS